MSKQDLLQLISSSTSKTGDELIEADERLDFTYANADKERQALTERALERFESLEKLGQDGD